VFTTEDDRERGNYIERTNASERGNEAETRLNQARLSDMDDISVARLSFGCIMLRSHNSFVERNVQIYIVAESPQRMLLRN